MGLPIPLVVLLFENIHERWAARSFISERQASYKALGAIPLNTFYAGKFAFHAFPCAVYLRVESIALHGFGDML